jgi:6-bladed beta-propeller protein
VRCLGRFEQLAACSLFFCTACAGPPSDSEWVAEESRSGDTLTVRTVSGGVWVDARTPSVDVTIGVLDGDPSFMFGEITRLAEDRSGGIYVFDRQAPIIRHYDSNGEYLGDVGGPGSGPGEYKGLSLGMAVDSDGILYVSDWGNGRINRYLPTGDALDSWRIDAPFLTTDPGRWVFTEGAGRLLLRARYRDRSSILVVERGQVVDTLWIPEQAGLPDQRGGPYRVDQYWGWHPAGYVVVGVSDSYMLAHHRPSDILRFGRRVDPRPVHRAEAEEVRRRFEWMEAQPAYRAPEGEWIPDYMPPFSGLQVADDGNVWVRRNVTPIRTEAIGSEAGPPPITWTQPHIYDVFDSEGRYLGEVTFPDDVEPLLFGRGTILGIRRGSFDEQYVVRMSLASPTGRGTPLGLPTTGPSNN